MADKRLLTTSFTVRVGDGDYGPQNLVLEVPDQLVSFGGGIDIRLYPEVQAELHTSHGGSFTYKTPGNVGVLDVPRDFIEFHGEDRVQSAYPSTSDVLIELRWDIFYDLLGNKVTPSFTYDFKTGEVVASAPCYGAVQLAYQTTYRKCTYTPKVTRQGFTVTKTYDTLLAFSDGNVATLKINRDNDPTDSRDYVQVYEIYSELVTDKDGAWEKPDNWPTESETYGGVSRGSAPRKTGALSTRRVHAYVYANFERERVYDRKIRQFLEQPFSPATSEKNSSWRPKYLEKENIPDTYEASDGEEAEVTADFKERIRKQITELKKQYGLS